MTIAPEINGDTDPDTDDEMPDLVNQIGLIYFDPPWNYDGDLPDLVDSDLPDLVDSDLPDLPDLVDSDLPDLVDSDLPDLVDIDLAGLQILSGNHRLYTLKCIYASKCS